MWPRDTLTTQQNEALKVLEQAPDNGDAIIVLTEAARSKEDIEAAEEQLQKFPKKNDVSFYLASANLFFSKGDLSTAVNALQQALAADPKSSAAHMAMGNLHLVQKDQKQAGEEFKKAADLAPVRSIERLKYAAFTWGAGDAGEMRRIATDMTKRRRIISPAGSGWPSLPTKTRNTTRPSRFLKMFLAATPNTSMAADCKAMCYWQRATRKKRSKFWNDWTKPIRTFPSSNIIWRAHISRNNNVNQAKLALDQAVSINPNYDDAVLLLAQINLSTGHG